MIQNLSHEKWDIVTLSKIFKDPVFRKKFIIEIKNYAVQHHFSGIVFDFEDFPKELHQIYPIFLKEAKKELIINQLLLAITVPVADDQWDLKSYSRICDKIILMDYDQHWVGGPAGPIASQSWFVQGLNKAIKAIGSDKTIVAIGNYAYDWAHDGHRKTEAQANTIEEAWLNAHDNAAAIQFDPEIGNSSFNYEEAGVPHQVWLLDASSFYNQVKAAETAGVSGIALWRLGSEDPSIWNVMKTIGTNNRPDLSTLQSVSNVEVEGNGEVFRISEVPKLGRRQVQYNKDGLIVNETFQSLPTPYVINRKMGGDHLLALTFDDGPDGVWTPKILDILKKEKAQATFFVIGENALLHAPILNRIIEEGHEIGNHSYTHPNLANVTEEGTKIELNLTERLVEAYTGRAMNLFRAPYFGDAEPTTPNELIPALNAQNLGYTNVGLHVDPGDWLKPGVEFIVHSTLHQVMSANADRSGQIILLHDSGGDREQTVKALPLIIEALRAKGYRFVTVSQLMGRPTHEIMPKVKGEDLASVREDIGVFLLVASVKFSLKILFIIAIMLGIVRALALTILAIRQKIKSRDLIPPNINPDLFVSVIIPAYNEEKVIASSIERVLQSENANIEIIIANDGSTDRTSQIVRDKFAHEPKITLLDFENGGKASALNKALKCANGKVIVALDADTQFEKSTIAKLVRWFEDESIGAVAGNAMVGNANNLVTKWQAIEYVTAQNLERRALAGFDAITVVPGAVGAWRKAALTSVNHYPEDTIAEDQDLTIAIQRKGWKVIYDDDAYAWTEAPESFKALEKQRFRWAFGTLQCLWKHRSIFKDMKPKGLALIGLPQAWLFQIIFSLISPLIDLMLVLSLIGTMNKVHQHGIAATQTDLILMSFYWVGFLMVDIGCGFIAYRLEKQAKNYPVFLLVIQRIVYRQIMYSVVIKAFFSAITGLWTGWGKLERTGRVKLENATT
ncbi:glycosyl transferase family 2 [Candidatus Phycosocius spiralis]|uniref:Chitooligosaccharide deacetylase n=2 Tax=Candidatus Phycosocius spiralis TaxID=2815099 RepID=A0ABQ4PYV5_9PROT|nr:glycosyl transferase family 2 [Candidatus Phycosocius spiralis]